MANFVYPNFSGGGGGVSSVTASAPLSSSGGATPDISYLGPFTSDVEIETSGPVGPRFRINNTSASDWRVVSSGAADPAGAGAFALQSYTDGTTPFTILPTSNNIGINTVTPWRRMHILNKSAQVDNLALDQANTIENLVIDTNQTTDNGIRINAGVGRVPLIRWSTSLQPTPFWEQQAGANNYLIYRFGQTASFAIDYTTRFVGINTAAPGAQLDVVGSLRASGNLSFFGSTLAGQQTGGSQTASGTYGATEQDMLQKAYDCLRTFGLLS